MTTATTPRPLAALPWAWLASAGLVGALGYLLFAISDHAHERTAGGLLLGVAVLALVAGSLTRRGAPDARRTSLTASAAAAVGGLAAGLVAAAGPAGAGDLWLVSGVPLACAGATALLALLAGGRARRRVR
ncbi:hypothetical protein SAMN05660464_3996 [Geodermatophilus dictyosporus]|uniref:Uncharacterized protein n=1 Tax=Geodermatophilus dictyosporus TaxID=1523247 RepID=A0A1I5SI59_9ACTN|nr:hypothetical protein [Geodermatophilus dictyosporus]SFP70454.1 hypothetical protein SAMN05660464_3996 [Geodermatophilus dictyosporus]